MTYPRRTLLGGIAATASLSALSGLTAASDLFEDTPTVTAALESLPASMAADAIVVGATDFEARSDADEPYGGSPHLGGIGVESDGVVVEVGVTAFEDSSENYGDAEHLQLLAGDLEIENEPAAREETPAGTEYERYDLDHGDGFVAALSDQDVYIQVESASLIDDVIDAADGQARLIETDEMLAEALEVVDEADSYHVHTGDGRVVGTDEELPAAKYVAVGETVLDADTIELQAVFAAEEASELTDEVVDELEGEFDHMPTTEPPTVSVEDDRVVATAKRDLAAERAAREHDSPGMLRVEAIDPEAEFVEITVGRGDPTPVDDLTLELDDAAYDVELWADGQETIEADDTILVAMDDVEPRTDVRLTHDHQAGSSSSGTTILNWFEFEADYDRGDETLTIEYVDDYPLDGDRLTVAQYDQRAHHHAGNSNEPPEPVAERTPWTGETLTDAEPITVDNIEPGSEVLIGWDGVSRAEAIFTHFVQPPGQVEFDVDIDKETVDVTLETEYEEEAAAYTLEVDDEPTEVQFSDDHDTIDGSVTVTVTDLELGDRLVVVWDDDHRVGSSQLTPRIELAIDDGTVEHTDGDEVAADRLTLEWFGEDGHGEVAVEDHLDGEFEVGDEIDLEADVEHVMLRFDDEYRVGHAHVELER